MVEVSGEVRVTATVSVWICWSHCDVPLGTPLRRPYSRSLVQPLRLARCPTHSEDIGNAQSSHSRRKIRTEQPTAASERSTMPWPDSTHTGSRERRSFCTGCRPSEPPVGILAGRRSCVRFVKLIEPYTQRVRSLRATPLSRHHNGTAPSSCGGGILPVRSTMHLPPCTPIVPACLLHWQLSTVP
jgi:hypothetical protein